MEIQQPVTLDTVYFVELPALHSKIKNQLVFARTPFRINPYDVIFPNNY